jgi:hypothetical protein
MRGVLETVAFSFGRLASEARVEGTRETRLASEAAKLKTSSRFARADASPYNRLFPSQFMNGPVLRLIDANANRAREALRVVEDYCRFVLNDETLSGSLKSLRHCGATT